MNYNFEHTKTEAYLNVHHKLLEKLPEFQSLYDQHLEDFDEVLPHVLMADFTRFFEEAFQDNNTDVIHRCSQFVEYLITSGDLMLEELAQVSFLENLEEVNLLEVKKVLGPVTQYSFDRVFKDTV